MSFVRCLRSEAHLQRQDPDRRLHGLRDGLPKQPLHRGDGHQGQAKGCGAGTGSGAGGDTGGCACGSCSCRGWFFERYESYYIYLFVYS